MRVISGTAGRVRLVAPRSLARPSTDRLREALFAILGERVLEATVLDLFAGSGSQGIEALSRGASQAVFVDEDRAAVAALQRNLERTRLRSRAQIVAREVFAWMESCRERFDLAFADPPYAKAEGDRDLAGRLLLERAFRDLVKRDGLVIVETNQTAPPQHAAAWRPVDRRRYGRSHLHFFAPEG